MHVENTCIPAAVHIQVTIPHLLGKLWLAILAMCGASCVVMFSRYSAVLKLVGGLEHGFYFSVYSECHHPN